MPRREDLHTILLLGSGPIVIGQGCEFDYSGTQACKALRDEGFRIVLINSNPATIMTDPALSDRTYLEPITPATVRMVLEKERSLGTPIDAVLPTLGGQTALNCACALHDEGVFEEFGVEMIGASREVIHRAEDREAFKKVCDAVGLATPDSRTVSDQQQADEALEELGLPAIIRPAFTLGGWGGGIAYNRAEFVELVQRGLAASMIDQVQIDRSLLGWKEYELEVVRDQSDNCVIVCSIENIDPMGVHTGDSTTVAPALTLTDKEYQVLRDASLAIMREVGVETGGSNVQFAVNPRPAPAGGNDPMPELRDAGTTSPPQEALQTEPPFEFVVIEMNPRVSRSSALASKATGFPIAKIAAKLAVGYTLDELRNDVTGTTSACFEPSLDYVVTKMPRWTFEKFPEADETLTTQMKSVGEAMSIGRTFKESFQKVIRSMDVKRFGLGLDRNDKWLAAMRAVETQQLVLDLSQTNVPGTSPTGLRTADGQPIEWPIEIDKLTRKLTVPSQGRLYYIRYALKMGWTAQRVCALTGIDPFFVDQIAQLIEFEDVLCEYAALEDVPEHVFRSAKQLGYSDAQLANLYLGTISSETILRVRARRESLGVKPIFRLVDTCAAEFEALTPYYYSTYDTGYDALEDDGTITRHDDDETALSPTPKVIILGGGPNRIGQGIEFDYCCVHAAMAAHELGYESVMINSNPETVSTDYDTSDLLFFEPLTLEDVLNVVDRLNGPDPKQPLVKGVIVQFGGQTPLNLVHGLDLAGVKLLGTSLDAIDLAEDRDRFDSLLDRLSLQRPDSGIARTPQQAMEIADRIGFPVLVRPSYVLGGRGMEICPDAHALEHFVNNAIDVSGLDEAPILIDKFLGGATEIDVDVVADFHSTGSPSGKAVVCGVLEHIEHAGVHSGDSSCCVPPWTLGPRLVERIKDVARSLAKELRVCGLMNLQLAMCDGELFIIEVNPRASRTIPFIGKANGVAWASVAAKAMMGESLESQDIDEVPDTGTFAVKAPVFPFQKFPGVDFVLGPEMRSTGEVMGLDLSMPTAYLKAMHAAGVVPPSSGEVFLSVRSEDKASVVDIARSLFAMGFKVYTTAGTGHELERHGMKPKILQKIAQGARPNVLDLMANHQISLVINTPTRTGWKTDEGTIRATSVRLSIPMVTTLTGASAMIRAIEAQRAGGLNVVPLQDYPGLTPQLTT